MSNVEKVRVLVVDDHPLMRLGLRTKIDCEPTMEVVAEAGDGAGAIAAFASHRPDVVLLDLRLPDMPGPQVITAMKACDANAKILVLTSYDAIEDIHRALKAGARGYMLKGTFGDGIIDAIRSVHAGSEVIAPELAARLAERADSPSLSAREIAVLELVVKGLRNKEIAVALSLREDTVKFHLKNIFVKLGVEDRTEAVFVALQRGIVLLQ